MTKGKSKKQGPVGQRQRMSSDFCRLRKTDIRKYLLVDPVFRICAGPEQQFQRYYLQLVFKFLEGKRIKHPCFPQSISPGDLEKHYVGAKGSPEFKNFEAIVNLIVLNDKKLSPVQRKVWSGVFNLHGSFFLAFMYAEQYFDSECYAMSLLAARCLVPGFSDVTKKEFRKRVAELKKQVKGLWEDSCAED